MKEFHFLVEAYGFVGPIDWNMARERVTTYVRDRIFVDINYDGRYYVTVGEMKDSLPEISADTVKHGVLNARRTFDIYRLMPQEFRNPECLAGRTVDELPEEERKQIEELKSRYDTRQYYARLLRQNPDLLEGKWGVVHNATKWLRGKFVR